MYIILDDACCQAFLAALSRRAAPAFSATLRGNKLELKDVSPADAAWALAFGAFPAYEKRLLRALAQQGFAFLDPEEREQLPVLAENIAACDLYRGTPVSGPGRLRRLRLLLMRELETGGLDFGGFCRFRLPGHRSYLRYLLDCAAAELIARQEEEEFAALLRELSRPLPDSREWRLEFFRGGSFALKGDGFEEGGRWTGREDALVADLISRRPGRLQMRGLAFAPLSVTACLEKALGERLDYSHDDTLDKDPG